MNFYLGFGMLLELKGVFTDVPYMSNYDKASYYDWGFMLFAKRRRSTCVLKL